MTDEEGASTSATAARVAADPRYRKLVKERARFSWLLSAIMVAVFFGYIGLIAYDRALLARPVAGGATTLGIPVGIGVILAAIILTGIYVRRANRHFDPMMRAIRKDAGL
jgi:uncharacterized membrane protein (DUF485 family)